MPAFWNIAARMLNERWLLLGAIVAAIISAMGLGAGLLAATPVLEAVVGEGRTLPEMAADFNTASPVDIPDAWIALLPTRRFTAVLAVVGSLCVLTVAGAAANFLHQYWSLTLVERTVGRLRREAFARVVRFPLFAADPADGRAADRVSRVVYDPSQLGAGLGALLGKAVAQVTKGAAAFAAAFITDWRLTLITIVLAPVLYAIVRRLNRQIRRASRAALSRQADLYESLARVLSGVRTVKLSRAEAAESGRFRVASEDAVRQMLRVRFARAVSGPSTEVLAIVVLAVMALVAVKAVEDGEITAAAMVITMGALGAAGAALKPMTGILNDISQSSAAAERLAELLKSPVEPRGRGLPTPASLAHAIELQGVHVTYPGAPAAALRGVSLRIARGERVALVGPNGSGKTTLLTLIPRLMDPTIGRVTWDGVDLRTLRLAGLRKRIAAVSQDVTLFAGSFRDNIAYGLRNAADDDILAAAAIARATDFIAARGGLDAPLADAGGDLSGGQRQRIAIARAVLRSPDVLLLDEATSMIDAESERAITDALNDFAKGRTTIVVAHRLATVTSADRIVVLDQGRVLDQGTHDELLRRCDLYQRLAATHLAPAP